MSSVIHLGRLSIAATGIITGGLALGAALASYANPLPRAAAPAPWESALSPKISAGTPMDYAQSMPEDLYPGNLPQGFAPASATSEIAWPAQFAPRYADSSPLPALDERPIRDTPDATPVMADRDVAVPHYAAMERSAQPASSPVAEPADDGQPVASADTDPSRLTMTVDPANPPPIPTGGARLIHVSG